ncbi:AfsR/SARP family transcriptional regulator [Microbispora sp. KK1-11]|uniref:AfsR/SARP family transcriptional regulator n=1 Tax=Microbispora sp. KK1-11 TaxID=2053005 RepID=UPI00115A2C67|nr:AfsR/SARP family transcriptional regulator [Microbispora sp. KK1-11]TQS20819.1 AfsR/SARP family transcriptional regulator [Microbispora sp. KK1-11]
MTRLRFKVLGFLEVADETGRPIRLQHPGTRALVATLLERRHTAVSSRLLCEVLWPSDPPGDPRGALNSRLARLRRALPPDTLIRRPGGYGLNVHEEMLDSVLFERLLGEAVREGRRDAAQALACLDRALALWRGSAYEEFSDIEQVRLEAVRLDELRVTAGERRVELLLRLGRWEQAVAGARDITALHPFREVPHAHLMKALYHGGRHQDALAVYDRYRRELAVSLGLEPSEHLRRLSEAIVRQTIPAVRQEGDEDPRTQRRGAATATRRALVLRQEETRQLTELIDARPVAALIGPMGVGKSHLAREVLTALYGPGILPGAVLDLAGMPARVAAGLVRQRLAHGDPHETVLIDNCDEAVDAITPILRQAALDGAGPRVIATARCRILIDGCPALTLLPLAVPEDLDEETVRNSPATAFLIEHANAAGGRVAVTDRDAAHLGRLCRRLDGLPLALKLIAPRLATLTPRQVVIRMEDPFPLLRVPGDGRGRHTSMSEELQASYRLLNEQQRLVLSRLAAHREPATLNRAEALCVPHNLSVSEVAAALDDLVACSMVRLVDDDFEPRFATYNLVRDYLVHTAARRTVRHHTRAVAKFGSTREPIVRR